jgi:GNAT superfamily N-acetyltransferase
MPIDHNTKLRIETFNKEAHDYKSFSCGVERLDNYLIRNAASQHADSMVRVYVVVEDGKNVVLAYIVINVGHMDAAELTAKPKGTPAHNNIPIMFISRIATAHDASGNGIGKILMDFAFQKACTISDNAGCFGVLLDIFEDGGEEQVQRRKTWYTGMGFTSFVSDPNRMFVTIQYLKQLIDARK